MLDQLKREQARASAPHTPYAGAERHAQAMLDQLKRENSRTTAPSTPYSNSPSRLARLAAQKLTPEQAAAVQARADRAMGITKRPTLKQVAEERQNAGPMRDISNSTQRPTATGYMVSGMVMRDATKSKTHALNFFTPEGFSKVQARYAPAGKSVRATDVTLKRDGSTIRAHVGKHDMEISVSKQGKYYTVDGGRIKSKSLSGVRTMIAKEIQDVNNFSS